MINGIVSSEAHRGVCRGEDSLTGKVNALREGK